MSNRAARRATARGRGPKTLAGFQFLLTPDEAELVEEALDAYMLAIDVDFEGAELPPATAWARDRANRIRMAMSAALENRPYQDIHPDRFAPRPPEAEKEIHAAQ